MAHLRFPSTEAGLSRYVLTRMSIVRAAITRNAIPPLPIAERAPQDRRRTRRAPGEAAPDGGSLPFTEMNQERSKSCGYLLVMAGNRFGRAHRTAFVGAENLCTLPIDR
jgi:hypothetical protein